MELSEEAKAEIAAAIQIVKEDKMYAALQEMKGHGGKVTEPVVVPEPVIEPQPEPGDPVIEPGKGKTPPPKPAPEPVKRASLWGNYAE